MILRDIALTLVETVADVTPLIPYYHVVSDDKLPHIRHLYPYKNERQFIEDMDFLCRRYQPVSLGDLIESVRQGRKIKKGSFIVTFDDGYSQTYSVAAPILFKKGIPAIFFLTTDFLDNRDLSHNNKASLIVEYMLQNAVRLRESKHPVFGTPPASPEEQAKRILAMRCQETSLLDEMAFSIGLDFKEYLAREQPYLDSAQIRKMIEMGFYFGAHSLSHPYFGDLSLQDQLRQALGSLQVVKDRYGLAYSVFAFPHDDRSVDIDFFRSVEKILDLTFGTSGIKRDPIATNLQRINFERTLRPASEILLRQLTKKVLYGRSENQRNR